jgi:hypothetical protein
MTQAEAPDLWPQRTHPRPELSAGTERSRETLSRSACLATGVRAPVSRLRMAIVVLALLSVATSECSVGAPAPPRVPPTPTVDYSADRVFATAEPACQKYWIWIDRLDLVQGDDDRARVCGDWLPRAKERVIALSACWEALPRPVEECSAEYYLYSRGYVQTLRDIVEEVDIYCYQGGNLDKALDLVGVADRILEDREIRVRDCRERKW